MWRKICLTLWPSQYVLLIAMLLSRIPTSNLSLNSSRISVTSCSLSPYALHLSSTIQRKPKALVRGVLGEMPYQEKYSQIIIDCKEFTKTIMTAIHCNQLAEVDIIGYNPIIIILQSLTDVISSVNCSNDSVGYNQVTV